MLVSLSKLLTLLLLPCTAHAFSLAYSSDGSIKGAHLRDMEEMVALFKKTHPECEITLRTSTSFVDGFIKSNPMNEPDDVPDVAVLYRTTWPRLANRDKLHLLSDFFTPAELARLRRSIRPELFADYYGKHAPAGKYALPLERSFPALLVNLAALPSFQGRESFTWDELFKALKPGTTFTLPSDHWTVTYLLSNAIGKPILAGTTATLTDPRQLQLVGQIAALKKQGVVVTVPMHHDAMVSFANGETAAALVTTSSFQTASKLAHFPFVMLMPPYLKEHRLQSGGADLVLPARSKGDNRPDTKRDIKIFLTWLLSPRINALWAVKTGYLPVIKLAVNEPLFKAELVRLGPVSSIVPVNRAHWTTYPFHKLEEFCNYDPLSSLVSAIFNTTLDAPDAQATRDELRKGEEALRKLLAKQCVD